MFNGSENKILSDNEGKLTSIHFLERYLDTPSILAFSESCQTAKRISYAALLKRLLTAIIEGNESLAKKLVTYRAELLLDASATAADLSGKKITKVTPLQAAICAGDVDMVQMISNVLKHKLQVGINLSFNPEFEVHRHIARIYPNGDINAKESEQTATAQEFKTSMLRDIFTAINAATPELVKFELDNPGQHTGSNFNAALHKFRTQFATTANSERIFNPFYLLAAFEFYNEQFDNFNGIADSGDQWNRKMIFWCQIIGFIQRHLPACLLQAFAQGINYTENNEKLNREFKFTHAATYMRPTVGDLIGLGYTWAACADACHIRGPVGSNHAMMCAEQLQNILRTKKAVLENFCGHNQNGSKSKVDYKHMAP